MKPIPGLERVTPNEVNAAVGESLAWRCTNEGWVNPDNVEEPLPDYCHDLNAIWDVKEKLGLHNRDNVELRVQWVNTLRMVVGRDLPKNKAGRSVVSDVDLLNATALQHTETLLRMKELWMDVDAPQAT